MYQYATIGIMLVNRAGIIAKANPFAEGLFGYGEGELEGKNVDILVPDALRGTHEKHRTKYHKHPTERVMGAGLDLFAQHKDGTTFPVEISLGHIDFEGTPLAIAYINNITTRKQVMEAVEEGKSRLASIIDTAVDGIITISKRGLVESINPAAARLFGYHPEEVIGNNIKMLMPEPDKSGHDQYLKNYQTTHHRKIIDIGREVTGLKKDGTKFPFHLGVSEVKLKDSIIYTGILHDLTEKKIAEEQLLGYAKALETSQLQLQQYAGNLELKVQQRTKDLEESQYKLNEAQAIAQVGHWEWNLQKEQLFFSKGMYRIFDLKENSAVTTEKMISYFHPEDRQMILDKVAAANQKQEDYSLEHRIITPKKNLKFVHSKVKNIQVDDAGNLKQLFGVLRDITQEKTAALKLEAALEKERELGELKSRFVSMASHEFRTPLSSILSSAGLLGMYLASGRHGKCEKNINRIISSVRNLTGILNDFLSLEKLEAGKVQLQKTEFDLADYLEELQEEMKTFLKEGQQIQCSYPNAAVLHSDAHLLTNIFINLLSNAIKYSPNGEDVKLSFAKEDTQWLVQVIDQGIGIPQEDQVHMFSRFFRASNAEHIKGIGLGLTIVKRYLDLLGGTIGFESEYGKGSTFYFTLPT